MNELKPKNKAPKASNSVRSVTVTKRDLPNDINLSIEKPPIKELYVGFIPEKLSSIFYQAVPYAIFDSCSIIQNIGYKNLTIRPGYTAIVSDNYLSITLADD